MPNNPDNPRPHIQLTDKRYEDILQALENKPKRLQGLIAPLHPADIADVLERIPQKEREELAVHIPNDVLGDVLAELEEGAQEHILQTLESAKVAAVVENLESDDAVDIIQHLEEEQVEEAREGLDKQEKRLLKYAPNSAGGLMQLEVITAIPTQSVGDVLKYLRKNPDAMPDNPGTIFVVNENRKLLGTVSLARLVQCKLNLKLATVMRQKPITINPNLPESEVAKIFEKYDIHNCAVVNKKGSLLGRITIDDVLDSVLDAHERELKRSAGLDEKADLFAPVKETAYKRLPWLVINLFTAILASMVIAMFQNEIEQLVALAVLMPIVASMGGNAATQTMTVAVRGLATGQITIRNATTLLLKELTVGSLNGILLAIFLAIGVVVVYGNQQLGWVIFLATIANHIFAAVAGHIIPLGLKKLKYDPAISSGVLVTTITDVGGFFVFLGLASLMLL